MLAKIGSLLLRICPALGRVFPLSPDGALAIVMPLALLHMVCATGVAWLKWGWVAGACTLAFEVAVIGAFAWKLLKLSAGRARIGSGS